MRLALAVLAASVLAPVARAETEDAEDDAPDEPARPIRLQAKLVGAVAELRLGELVELDGPIVQQWFHDLPRDGVVTAASVRSGTTTRPLALVAADVATRRLEALEARAPSRDLRSAVALSMGEHGPVTITALAPRRTSFLIELVVEAPTCYLDDRRHVAIPTSWAGVLDTGRGRDVVPDGPRADRLDERCGDRDGMTWLALATDDLAARPAGDDRIGVAAGRFAHGSHQVARVEVALARTLTAVPRDLSTVFVVDASRSMSDDHLATQRAVIASYVRHAPDGAVQVVAYDRQARPLLPGWRPGRTASTTIDRGLAAIVPRNGSDLDRGLELAARWLAGRPGTRRIVVLTDELLPRRIAALDRARLAALAPRGTLIHVVRLDHGDAALERYDASELAGVATATGGLAATASGTTGLDALALVRPTSLDRVRVVAPGFAALSTEGTSCAEPESTPGSDAGIALGEGASCTWWARGPAASDSITLDGWVWGRRWRRVVPLGDRESVAIARTLPGDVESQDPALANAAELAARAVNTKWSLLATWGGQGGYRDATQDIPGYGVTCSGRCGGGTSSVSHAYGARMSGPDVATQVRAAVAPCQRTGATIDLEIETTSIEIVEVAARVTSLPDATARAIEACAEAAVWDLELALANAPDHHTWSVRVGP